MNTIRLEFITSIGPGTSKQHQERDVDIKVFIDGQELDLGAGWDLQALIASGRQEGAYYLSNCSCGEPGCARIWAPMQVRHEADRIAWLIPMPFVRANGEMHDDEALHFSFPRDQYQAQSEGLLADLKRAATDGGFIVRIYGCPGELPAQVIEACERGFPGHGGRGNLDEGAL